MFFLSTVLGFWICIILTDNPFKLTQWVESRVMAKFFFVSSEMVNWKSCRGLVSDLFNLKSFTLLRSPQEKGQKHRSLLVDNLCGKISIAYLSHDNEKSRFLKVCSSLYWLKDVLLYHKLLQLGAKFWIFNCRWSADMLCTSQAIYTSRNLRTKTKYVL